MSVFLVPLMLSFGQLTWYEHYERGEKHYKRAEYQACLADMDQALQQRPQAMRNQFTRAVQKIDYKPFYYKALATYRLGNLLDAYPLTQKAFSGEVVANSPALQADLTAILDDYRRYIQEQHQQYQQEKDLIEARSVISRLLADDKLDEAGRRLNAVADSAAFSDLQDLVRLRQDVNQARRKVGEDILPKIIEHFNRGRLQQALAVLEVSREFLPPADSRLWQTKIEAAIAEVASERPEPSQAVETNDGAGNKPENAAMKALSQEELDELLASTRADVEAEYEKSFASLRASESQLNQRIDSVETRNKALQSQLNSQVEVPPQVFLSLHHLGGRKIKIEGEIFSAAPIGNWRVSLNGKELDLPEVQVDRYGARLQLNQQVRAGAYGYQEVQLWASDELGREAGVSKPMRLPKPWWFQRKIWFSAAAALLLLLGFGLQWRRRQRKLAMLRHFNPYIAGSPVRSAEMFYGRDPLLHRIQNLVHKNCFMIHGPRRMGKTSLLLQLKQNLESMDANGYRFFPVFADLQGMLEEDLFHHLMAEILHQASEWPIPLENLSFTEENQGYQSRQFSRDIKKLIGLLKAADHRHPVIVLLVDEVDVLNEFSEKTNQKLRSIFMKDYAECLSCVMAGIHLKKEWESSGSPWYNFFEEINIEALDEKAARSLILRPVQGIFQFSRQAVELILRMSGGHPYLIQKICVTVVDENLRANRFRVTRRDVERYLEQMGEPSQRKETA